jgi:TRAP-type mannitol/chloroaromatic compound transport system permease small subunit
MQGLLRLSSGIDWLNTKLGWIAAWACGVAAAICCLNAFIRYVLKANEHVRVDIIYTRLSTRAQVVLDIVFTFLFLLTVTAFLAYICWPYFMRTYVSNEMSSTAGGLIRWPVVLTLPVGFALVFLQGISEIIKRVGFLAGKHSMAASYERPLQ